MIFSSANQVRRENPFWTENKTWHEGNINLGIRNKSFTVSDVYPNKPFTAYVKMQDFASNISSNSHRITLAFKLK
ncbi:MAG: hypothetical protein H6613_01990 [Ignavibacteriales bacterium]|nr:hypothetical protein [Ignavibacteriales bacterium]